MFRPGKNPKDSTPHADDTADHTPHTTSSPSYGSAGAGSASTPSSGVAAEHYQSPTQTPTTSRAVSESESLARDIKEGTLAGFVGNGTSLTGEANFKGMLRVDGALSGRVSSSDGTLIVSTNGQVDANIEVAVAQIYGTVNGDIIASKRIEMGRVARVVGNIQTPALVIEQGAVFEGSCRMMQLREQQEKQGARKEGTAPAASANRPAGAPANSTPTPPRDAAKTPSPSPVVTPATDAVS